MRGEALVVLLLLAGCGSCGEPEVRAKLLCKTSRFPLMKTTGPIDLHEHSHGSQDIVLPLARGQGRCPARGRILVEVSSSPGSKPHEVRIRALGKDYAETVRPGEVTLTASVALSGATVGVHELELTVDGRRLEVPKVEIIP